MIIENSDKPTRDTDNHPAQQEQKLVKKIKNYIYDPSDLIGSGFSSHVFKGINEFTNETIAIKVLELSKIQNQVEKYLLNNQINALRALSHPNILRTIEILMTKNNVYIMTEFCERGDLQQVIKKAGRLQQFQSLLIIRDIVEGYRAIQEKNIVHRDLKTANIFLTSTGARIADFGFCEFLGDKKPQIPYNVGSPAYMSPESYKQNLYSPKSDIWSIGIILYEMLVGQTPDKNLTYTEMVNNLMAGRINNVSDGVRQILKKCFKREVKERCSARQLMEMINMEIARIEGNKKIGGIQQSYQQNQQQIQSQPFQPQQFIGQQLQQQIVTNSGLSTSSQKVLTRPAMQTSTADPRSFTQQPATNKPMLSSMLPIGSVEQGNAIRSQSPFKTRFKRDEDKQQIVGRVGPSFSMQINNNTARFKPHIEILLFLFRLLKYTNDSPVPLHQSLSLLLFRHRTQVQSLLQPISEQEKTFQTYKEFQYLKSKFDQLYLQGEMMRRQPRNQARGGLDPQILIDSCRQCDAYVGRVGDLPQGGKSSTASNYSDQMGKVGVIWDYLMLEYEAILLLNNANSLQVISDRLHLQAIMKEQPRKLSSVHFQLLRIKWRMLQENGMIA